MFFRKPKEHKEIVDKDIQLIKFLKSQNLSELTMGKIDMQTYELQDAEIEAIGMRMAERRIKNVEDRINK